MYSRLIPVLFTLAFSLPASAASYPDLPIMLQADQVLTNDLLKGKNYTVDATVRNDGLINTYTLETEYGTVSAESTVELKMRIDELNALLVMEEIERTEVFKDAVVSGVKATGEGIVELVTSPIDTTTEMVKGIGQFLSNIGEALVSDDPDQDNVLKVALGYDAAKRKFAYEFGISPYSEYEPAMDRLGEIARSAVAGGMAPKVALAAVDHDLATIAQISGTMRGMQKLVRDNPPNKLRKINHDKLRDMQVSEELAEAILDNYNYDPYEETLLIGELETMQVIGRELFIRRATLVTEKSTAIYYRTLAQLIGSYHRKIEPVEAIVDTVGVINLQRKDGGRVLLTPVDHVFWTQKLAAKIDSFEQALDVDDVAISKELWLSGRIDPAARKQFEAHGWKVHAQVNDTLLK